MVSARRIFHEIPYRFDGMPLFHNIHHHGRGINVAHPLVLEKGALADRIRSLRPQLNRILFQCRKSLIGILQSWERQWEVSHIGKLGATTMLPVVFLVKFIVGLGHLCFQKQNLLGVSPYFHLDSFDLALLLSCYNNAQRTLSCTVWREGEYTDMLEHGWKDPSF
jgi:hypothetical protein